MLKAGAPAADERDDALGVLVDEEAAPAGLIGIDLGHGLGVSPVHYRESALLGNERAYEARRLRWRAPTCVRAVRAPGT
jgi:hypothetical protein